MAAKLKPCPFCGEVPILSYHYEYNDQACIIHRCPVIGAFCIPFTDFGEAETVVKRWNTRFFERKK